MPYTSQYTTELGDEICEKLADGVTLSEICRGLGIARSSVHDWRAKHDEFAMAYDLAKQAGHDALADECLRIADDGSQDKFTDDEGRERVDTEVVQRSKLRVWTRLQLLAKWDPRYREKQELEHKGKVTVTHEEFLERLE